MRIFVLVLCLGASSLFAHNLEHTVSHEEAIVVSYRFASEGDFSFQSYEIYAPHAKLPFQVGRTNANAELLFIPNVQGKWKIKAFSEDGHGKIIELDVADVLQKKSQENSFFLSLLKPLFGVLTIVALFGLIYFNKRKKIEKS